MCVNKCFQPTLLDIFDMKFRFSCISRRSSLRESSKLNIPARFQEFDKRAVERVLELQKRDTNETNMFGSLMRIIALHMASCKLHGREKESAVEI